MTSPNHEAMNHSKSNQSLLQEVFDASGLDQKGLAQYLGTSYFSVVGGSVETSNPERISSSSCNFYLRT